MKYPGPVIPLKYCVLRKGRLNWNSGRPSRTIAMPGPMALPTAMAIAKAAEVIVRNLKGVASATYLGRSVGRLTSARRDPRGRKVY